MKFWTTTMTAMALMLSMTPVVSQEPASEQTYHMKMDDPAGLVESGYCLEILGRPGDEMLDMPLIAHSCKLVLAPDDAIVHNGKGEIVFPAFDLCVTAMGLNVALEYNSLMLKECGLVEPYLNAPPFQAFEINDGNQVQLMGSELCLTIGDLSSTTTRPDHHWRALYLQDCAGAPLERSRWYLNIPE